MNIEKHITILAILNIAFGAIFLFVGIAALLLLAGIGVASGEPEAVTILGVVGLVGCLFFCGIGLPGIFAGIGLLKHRLWGKYLAIGLAFLNLFAIPIGTALGIYAIWVLLSNDADVVFGTKIQMPQTIPVSQ
jgi:hypothetical protein